MYNFTMKGQVTEHRVAGNIFRVFSDFGYRATFAQAEDGTVKQLCGSGYIHKDLTVRKAIAVQFGLPTFRKEWKRG